MSRRRANAYAEDNPFMGGDADNAFSNPEGFPDEDRRPPVTTKPRGGDVDRSVDVSVDTSDNDPDVPSASMEARMIGSPNSHSKQEGRRMSRIVTEGDRHRARARRAFREPGSEGRKPQVGNNPGYDHSGPRAEDRVREGQNYDTLWRGERDEPYYEPLDPVYPRPGDEPERVEEYGPEDGPEAQRAAEGARRTAATHRIHLTDEAVGFGTLAVDWASLGIDLPGESVIVAQEPGNFVIEHDLTDEQAAAIEADEWTLRVERVGARRRAEMLSEPKAGHCTGCGRSLGNGQRTVVYTGPLSGEWCTSCTKREDVANRWSTGSKQDDQYDLCKKCEGVGDDCSACFGLGIDPEPKVSVRCASCGQQGKIALIKVSAKTKCRCGSPFIDFTDRVATAQRHALTEADCEGSGAAVPITEVGNDGRVVCPHCGKRTPTSGSMPDYEGGGPDLTWMFTHLAPGKTLDDRRQGANRHRTGGKVRKWYVIDGDVDGVKTVLGPYSSREVAEEVIEAGGTAWDPVSPDARVKSLWTDEGGNIHGDPASIFASRKANWGLYSDTAPGTEADPVQRAINDAYAALNEGDWETAAGLIDRALANTESERHLIPLQQALHAIDGGRDDAALSALRRVVTSSRRKTAGYAVYDALDGDIKVTRTFADPDDAQQARIEWLEANPDKDPSWVYVGGTAPGYNRMGE